MIENETLAFYDPTRLVPPTNVSGLGFQSSPSTKGHASTDKQSIYFPQHAQYPHDDQQQPLRESARSPRDAYLAALTALDYEQQPQQQQQQQQQEKWFL